MKNIQALHQLKLMESPDATWWNPSPALVLDKAKGCFIIDIEGQKYLDLCAGFGSLSLGHNHPEFIKMLNKWSIDDNFPPVVQGLGDLYPSSAKIKLFQNIQSILPDPLSIGILSLSGSQAVESALKTAMIATKKSGFIVFDGSYHGVDLGTLPVTYRNDFKSPFSNYLKNNSITSLPYGCASSEISSAIRSMEKSAGCAGILVEPIQGRAGFRLPPHGWLTDLREIATANHVPLIFDEVFTGMGRTGIMTQAELITPDLICLGKGLGGGLPISACFGTEALMSSWPKDNPEAIHTGTFYGHPLTCMWAQKVIEILRSENFLQTVTDGGKEILDYTRTKCLGLPQVADVRGQGFMIAIEFKQDGFGAQLMDQLKSHNIIALASGDRGESLSMTPPLNIDIKSWKNAVDTIAALASKSV